jgi:hypothetical protein
MVRLVLLFLTIAFCNCRICCAPIATPDFDERNRFVIKAPDGWGYRTFNGENGLIGVFWPFGTSFNSSDTAIFVFLQNDDKKLPVKPDNINLFKEKCPDAKFRFSDPKNAGDETLSIAEEYFSGRCGKTMILFKEVINNYTVIILLASAKYVSQKQLSDAKEIATNYRKEIEKSIPQSDQKTSEPAQKEDGSASTN